MWGQPAQNIGYQASRKTHDDVALLRQCCDAYVIIILVDTIISHAHCDYDFCFCLFVGVQFY